MASAVAAGPQASFISNLRRFDAYPKTMEDFRIKTCGGALITILSGALIVSLFVAELQFYMGMYSDV